MKRRVVFITGAGAVIPWGGPKTDLSLAFPVVTIFANILETCCGVKNSQVISLTIKCFKFSKRI